MAKYVDLDNHLSITSVAQVAAIIRPISDALDVKHFRYLRLYEDGSRFLLSNHADCTRFVYEEGNYKSMWYDGEFPEKLLDGWHQWRGNALKPSECKTDFELTINSDLGLHHGLTFVRKDIGYWEVITFDSDQSSFCDTSKGVLTQFLFYFKEQARQLITAASHERILVPSEVSLVDFSPHPKKEGVLAFFGEYPC